MSITFINTTIATIAEGSHDYGVEVYTLPASAQIIKSAYMSMSLNSVGENIASDDPGIGLGTVMASGSDGTLAQSTDDDILTSQAATNCNGTPTAKTVGNQVLPIETGSPHEVNFNFAASWSSGGDTGCVIKGTIILEWLNII